MGFFAQWGWSDDDVIEAEQYYGLGMQWIGALPSRDADVWGLGFFHVVLSNEADFPKRHETAIELYYRAQLTPWFSVKPDLQYITNPGGSDNSDALAGGVRVELAF